MGGRVPAGGQGGVPAWLRRAFREGGGAACTGEVTSCCVYAPGGVGDGEGRAGAKEVGRLSRWRAGVGARAARLSPPEASPCSRRPHVRHGGRGRGCGQPRGRRDTDGELPRPHLRPPPHSCDSALSHGPDVPTGLQSGGRGVAEVMEKRGEVRPPSLLHLFSPPLVLSPFPRRCRRDGTRGRGRQANSSSVLAPACFPPTCLQDPPTL